MQGMGTLWDSITGEHTRSAGTVAESQDSGIKVKVDMLGIFHKVAVMGGGIQMRHTVGQSGEGERLSDTGDAPSPATSVGQFHTNGIIMIAAILRTRIVHILLPYCRLPPADGGRGMAVRVVVPRTAAIIGQSV